MKAEEGWSVSPNLRDDEYHAYRINPAFKNLADRVAAGRQAGK